jgi:hypothetical protein
MKLCRTGLLAGLLSTVILSAAAAQQPQSVNLVPAHDSLLPTSFGPWHQAAAGSVPTPPPASISLINANKAALEEDQPQRSQVADFTGANGRVLHVEAVEFADYTGAWSAYTLIRPSGLADAKTLGTNNAVAKDAILFTSGAVLTLVYPATAVDLKSLQPLAASLPQVHGSAAQPPLLPSFLPVKGLVPGSIRYATGASTYAQQGGVLPANSIGWDHSGEAVTAEYRDKRGDETLTILIYPTPQIATAHLHSAQAMLPGLGPKFATAKIRREMELVLLANGTFSPAAAQQMIANIHMRQLASVDKDIQPTMHQQVTQTASLLTNIAVLSGILCGAAVLLGLFLGGGRAAIRVMRGKPASVEIEFLSLRLANQNARPVFTQNPSREDPEKL